MRRTRLLAALVITSGFASIEPSLGSAQQPDFDAIQIRTRELGGGLAMLSGRGGNVLASVGEDGAFLVDDDYAPLTPKLLAALQALGGEEPRFVLNTHWHGDHTGGNENLGRAGAVIVAHEGVRKRMSVEQFQRAFDRRTPPAPRPALPIVTFASEVTLHLNGHEFHAFHVPGAHTDGDSIVHVRDANLVHSGDTYFAGRYPFIDLDSGGSIDGMIAAAERVLALCDADTRIVPGHGALSTRVELAEYRDMLVAVRKLVADGIAAGQDLEEIVAARPTAALDAIWGGGFIGGEALVRIVHASLTARGD